MYNSFRLNSQLASNSPADPQDTLNTKKTLNRLGYMQTPSYGLDDMPDKPLFDGIKNFQKDKGIKVDGVMNPGGETETTLNKVINGGLRPITGEGKKPKAKKPVKPSPQRPDIRPDDPRLRDPRLGDPNIGDPDYRNPNPGIGIPTSVKPQLPEGGVKPIPKPTPLPIVQPIKDGVGIGKPNNPEDVAIIRDILEQIGYKPSGSDQTQFSAASTSKGEADPDFLFDIQRFQKSSGLTVDGRISPNGETAQALKAQSDDTSHPGKPGPNLPIVMPGPGEGMSSECLEITREYEHSVERIKEIYQQIKAIENSAKSAGEKGLEFDDVSDVAGDVVTGVTTLGVLAGSARLLQIAAILSPYATALGAVALTVAALEFLLGDVLGLQKTAEELATELDTLEANLPELEKKYKKCNE